MRTIVVRGFDQWREQARVLLRSDVPPEAIAWRHDDGLSQHLFLPDVDDALSRSEVADADSSVSGFSASGLTRDASSELRVPREFLPSAELVACHRDETRWELLYRLAWRLTHSEPQLLHVTTDDDVRQFDRFAQAVRRDAHKMQAFVRFRKIEGRDGQETYVAWHRPDHHILPLTVPFFVKRFAVMRWMLMTPDASAIWDGEEVRFGAGVASPKGLRRDALEELWKTYYAATFNPARLNARAMVREMAVRHWPTLPETELIPDLIREASRRSETMIASTEGYAMSAADFLPAKHDLKSLRDAAAECQGCPLYRDATQTVFGRGPRNARFVMVGEVPGDMEDREGEPFVGPAGKLLDDALRDSNIDRKTVYVTNAVKHFKFKVVGGGRRLHQKPGIREMKACKPWLEAELEAIEPDVVVCLGATAAQSVISADFRITKQRGEIFRTDYAPVTLATYHPSAVLRAPDKDARANMYDLLVDDLRTAAHHVKELEATKSRR